jgi:hypothetical protein
MMQYRIFHLVTTVAELNYNYLLAYINPKKESCYEKQ